MLQLGRPSSTPENVVIASCAPIVVATHATRLVEQTSLGRAGARMLRARRRERVTVGWALEAVCLDRRRGDVA
jgi:hypothetical protein